MYKLASDRRQAALHRGRPADWVNGQERLTIEGRRRQAAEGLNILRTRLAVCADPEMRKQLIAEMRELEASLTELNRIVGRAKVCSQGFGDVFTQTAKEMLPKWQYQAIWKTATEEHNRRMEELKSLQSEGE